LTLIIDSHGLKAVVLSSSLKIRFISVLKDGDFSLRIKLIGAGGAILGVGIAFSQRIGI
jgi:hypothetical protein